MDSVSSAEITDKNTSTASTTVTKESSEDTPTSPSLSANTDNIVSGDDKEKEGEESKANDVSLDGLDPLEESGSDGESSSSSGSDNESDEEIQPNTACGGGDSSMRPGPGGIGMTNEDEEVVGCKCLFCDFTSHEPELMLTEHMKLVHEFEFKQFSVRHQLTQSTFICFINACRNYLLKDQQQRQGQGQQHEQELISVEQVKKTIQNIENDWHEICLNEKFMIPVIKNDGLLQYYIEEEDGELELMQDKPISTDFISDETSNLIEKIVEYEITIKDMKQVVQRFMTDDGKTAKSENTPTNSPSTSGTSTTAAATSGAGANASADFNRWYFESYDSVEIHSSMVSDKPRMEAYMNCILKNKPDFDGKTVLDLGCGTGILSMFCATAGAKKIFAIDNSGIIIEAMDIIFENGFSDRIKCISSAIEDFDIESDDELKSSKVDILVSEWMGYFLLFEGMLASYLYARDHVLKPGGLMFPNTANIYMCGIEDMPSYRATYEMWDNVYGYKMSTMKKKVLCEPRIEEINSTKVCTNAIELLSLDLVTCSMADAVIKDVEFILKSVRDCMLTSLIGYFNVGFTMGTNYTTQLKTGPFDDPTHWKQTVFLMPKPIPLLKGETVTGKFSCEPDSENPRALLIKITIQGQRFYYQIQ